MTRREIRSNCPEGYMVNEGRPVDMLGIKELWRIFENHEEPHLTRLPNDMIESVNGWCPARVPKEWGRPIYYKTV